MVTKRSMSIANCEEVLPGVIAKIGVDDKIILIDFAGIGRYISLFGSIRKPHDVLKEVIIIFCLWFFQILSEEI